MRNEPLIAECAFGWGKMLRLYKSYLDANGTCYPLAGLTNVRSFYQQVLGISSVRLELRFGKKKVVLRGIAAMEEAQIAIEYLTSQYLGLPDVDKGWSRTVEADHWNKIIPETQPGLLEDDSPASVQDLGLKERAQAPTDKVEAPNWLRSRQNQRELRQRRLQAERSMREHGFDVEKLAQRLKEGVLPEVPVPLRLIPGEHAHYSTDATLSSEPTGGSIRSMYPAKDHGKLILTNKRLIYIGRKNQIVLDYARLFHVSRLRGAIAFQAEHWYRREIFQVQRTLECTMYLECILERYKGSLYRARGDESILGDDWGGEWSSEGEARFKPFVSGAYLVDNEHTEEVTTMPLSIHSWNMAEMLDTMD